MFPGDKTVQGSKQTYYDVAMQYKAYLGVFRDFRATNKGVIAEYPATLKLYP